MPDIGSYLSHIGLPAGAIALAVGLVRGAKALETDANLQALEYVSGLLTKGDLKNIGKAGAGLVPFVFDRVFGPRPFSFRFISRSIMATTLFWIILLLLKRPNWEILVEMFYWHNTNYLILLCIWYIVDFVSICKARFLINIIAQNGTFLSSLLFVCVDFLLSYILMFLSSFLSEFVSDVVLIVKSSPIAFEWISPSFENALNDNLNYYLHFSPILGYFDPTTSNIPKQPSLPSYDILQTQQIQSVLVISTLLTTIWTLLLFISSLVAQLLVPIDYLRRFTTFWFKDVEHHPLTAIAKVAATLIIIGAMAIKVVRWIY